MLGCGAALLAAKIPYLMHCTYKKILKVVEMMHAIRSSLRENLLRKVPLYGLKKYA
jgi:hypothetical protein